VDATVSLILGLGLGLALGAAGGWILATLRAHTLAAQDPSAAEAASLRTRLEERERQVAELRARGQEHESATTELRERIGALETRNARLETEIQGEREATAEKLRLLGEAEKRLQDTFKALSAEALSRNNQSFLDLARTQLGEFQKGATTDLETRTKAIAEMVKPVQETLQKLEKEQSKAAGALEEQKKSIAASLGQLQGATAKLVQALRTSHVRGRWGEIQLRRVVEMAGMLDHCDFVEQPTISDGDTALRPDMLVRLPGGKHVVVDAKTPIEAYLKAIEAPDEAARETLLADHARQVRKHITALGTKAYWSQFEGTPDFVVMFLPGETFFSAALQHDPALIEFGVDQKVIPASPTTLIALLRAVAYGWQQERLAENAQAISALGRELHDRIRVMADHLVRLGKGLDGAVDAYNKAMRSLESRVLVSARKFHELGAASETEVPALPTIDTNAHRLQSNELTDEPPETDPDHA